MSKAMEKKIIPHFPGDDSKTHPFNNQNGSVMVLVLMVLAIMTVIGIVSSQTVVTENYIIRNVGIHKQNISLVESGLMQGLQQFLQIRDDNPDNFSTTFIANDWLNDINNAANPININWYEANFTARCLNVNNSDNVNTLPLLAARGENANNNLRIAVVGWEPVDLGTAGGSESVVVGSGAVWHEGRILSEYVSTDAGGNDNGNGLLRMEIGVKRQWVE